jgi:hypothetical protein
LKEINIVRMADEKAEGEGGEEGEEGADGRESGDTMTLNTLREGEGDRGSVHSYGPDTKFV